MLSKLKQWKDARKAAKDNVKKFNREFAKKVEKLASKLEK